MLVLVNSTSLLRLGVAFVAPSARLAFPSVPAYFRSCAADNSVLKDLTLPKGSLAYVVSWWSDLAAVAQLALAQPQLLLVLPSPSYALSCRQADCRLAIECKLVKNRGAHNPPKNPNGEEKKSMQEVPRTAIVIF